MEIKTKVKRNIALTLAEIRAKLTETIDRKIAFFEFLTMRDCYEEIAFGDDELWALIKEDTKAYLNSKYESLNGTWYLKPLKRYKCKYCGKDFRTKTVGQRFCCSRCQDFYNEVDHEWEGLE